MQEQELRQLLDAASALLSPRLRRSEPLRTVMTLLGRWLVDEATRSAERPEISDGADGADEAPPIAADAASSEGSGPDALGGASRTAPASTPPAPDRAPALPRRVVSLRIGDAVAAVPVEGDGGLREDVGPPDPPSIPLPTPHAMWTQGELRERDLSMITTRAALKSQGCTRLATAKEAGELGLASFDEARRSLIERARALPTCLLWMFLPDKPHPNVDVLRRIGRCYEALSAAARLAARIKVDHARVPIERLTAVLQCLAEASSALRQALDATWLDRPDVDQEEAHRWLTDVTKNWGVFVPRHMRLDDPADPDAVESLLNEIASITDRIDAQHRRRHDAKAAVQQLRYHVERCMKATDDETRLAQLARIEELVVRLGDADMGVDEREVRQAVQPLKAQPLASDPARMWLSALLAPTDAGGAAGEADSAQRRVRPWSDRVLRVRELLRGRTIVLIGGERRAEAEARLEEAFATTIEWVRLSEHGSPNAMCAPIARPEAAIVVMLIKFGGHGHRDKAAECAAAAGKPFVALPAGYSADRMAEAILQQADRRL